MRSAEYARAFFSQTPECLFACCKHWDGRGVRSGSLQNARRGVLSGSLAKLKEGRPHRELSKIGEGVRSGSLEKTRRGVRSRSFCKHREGRPLREHCKTRGGASARKGGGEERRGISHGGTPGGGEIRRLPVANPVVNPTFQSHTQSQTQS